MKDAYLNQQLPIKDRILDLLTKMTLHEKIRQLDQYAGGDFVSKDPSDQKLKVDFTKLEQKLDGIGFGALQNRGGDAKLNNAIQKYVLDNSRLKIPVLFCEEGLHGFFHDACTIFPQQITLASTFSPELAKQTGAAIAKEASALGVHEVWAPVLDLAREPRFGRTEETYGEDTYLASKLGAAFVKGMQGNDVSSPDKVISEPKHFTGYGIPVGGLNCMPAMMGRHEHHTYALPVFEAAFTEGGAINTMCSYSSIDTVPVANDAQLLTETLRDEWKMPGFVRSDMCAIAMLHSGHDVADSNENAILQAITAGVDMQLYDFPHEFYQGTLFKLVNEGKLNIDVIDKAVSRVLYAKFSLGLFDNPFTDENLHHVIHNQEHIDLALEVARQGTCLLKNQGNILPLSKELKQIAVIGPSGDTPRYGDYTYNPNRATDNTLFKSIQKIVSKDTKVHYAKGTDIIESALITLPKDWLKTETGEIGLIGNYYNETYPSGNPVVSKLDEVIDFSFINYNPSNLIHSQFSACWFGYLIPSFSLDGYIGVNTTDSFQLWINDQCIIDRWENPKTPMKVPFQFDSGIAYRIKLVYKNDNRGAKLSLGYSPLEETFDEAIRLASQADVAIIALGDSEETSGENFDRADLNLPGRQLELLQAIYQTGTPIILVLMSGRPLTITWENEHIPAILEAWFPGEKGANAIAEIIFGDCNPSGRLPMSFPRGVGQLPVHYNRIAAGGKRYLEMDWTPLYPFGYGLSYTTFQYTNLKLSHDTISPSDSLVVSFDISNTGDYDGDEVCQLYINDYYSSIVKPIKELKGFKRVSLRAGETKTVRLTLSSYELRTLTRDYRWVVESGDIGVMIGPNSMDIRLARDFKIC